MKPTHLTLGLSLMLAASMGAPGETELSIESLDLSGDVVLRLSGAPAGTVWQVENSINLAGWDVVNPGGVPVRFEAGE